MPDYVSKLRILVEHSLLLRNQLAVICMEQLDFESLQAVRVVQKRSVCEYMKSIQRALFVLLRAPTLAFACWKAGGSSQKFALQGTFLYFGFFGIARAGVIREMRTHCTFWALFSSVDPLL